MTAVMSHRVEKPTITTITSLSSDIIDTHILPRLDQHSLAAIASIYAIRSTSVFWKNMCALTWPSLSYSPQSFPSGGYRSFFAHASTVVAHRYSKPMISNPFRNLSSSGLILAIDIYYENVVIFSTLKILDQETSTATNFLSSPFVVEEEHERFYFERIRSEADLTKNLTLSCILIGGTTTKKRVINLSSFRPISVQTQVPVTYVVTFGTILKSETWGGKTVHCRVTVRCAQVRSGHHYTTKLKGVKLQVEDMEDKILNGKEFMKIMHMVLNTRLISEERIVNGDNRCEIILKKRYDDFIRDKTKKRERTKMMREALGCVSGLFWALLILGGTAGVIALMLYLIIKLDHRYH